ncbi:helix-turn-helix domain-containing protein, partial [Flavobacterium sp.]|uniref:helix-turn-helix domain-containing protein n=1 Tax=Flavobacterium sp. TaxID=239 RepID=UPI003C48EA62
KAIIDFHKSKAAKPKKGSTTYKETLALFESGLSPEAIAEKRNLNISTIMSHFVKLQQDGANINLYDFITKEEVTKIAEAKTILENPNALKPYFDYFEEEIGYEKIRLALAIIEKENT